MAIEQTCDHAIGVLIEENGEILLASEIHRKAARAIAEFEGYAKWCGALKSTIERKKTWSALDHLKNSHYMFDFCPLCGERLRLDA